MNDTKTVNFEFDGYYFIQDEWCTFMCDDNGEIICVIQDAFFNYH